MSNRKHKLLSPTAFAVLSGTISLCLFLAAPASSSNGSAAATKLNNEGVAALSKNDFDTAIQKFKDALRDSHGYTIAKENLAIAFNNYGLQEAKSPKKSLKFFHMATWLKPDNRTTRRNLDLTIKRLGKNPASFHDRIQLAQNAERENDFAGAVVEYRAALKIRDDVGVKRRLDEVNIPENWTRLVTDDTTENGKVTAAGDVDFGPFMADLQQRIKSAWFPPEGNETKKLVASFKVHSDGSASDIRLEKSSGMVQADEAAISAIKDAAPFHALPTGSPKVVDIQFTFDYNVFTDEETPKETEQQLKKSIAKWLKKKNFKLASKAEISLAQFYVAQEQDEGAIDQYKRAIQLIEQEVEDKALEATAVSGLADIYYNQEDHSSAQPLYRRCLDLRLKDGKDKQAIAAAQRDLGYATLYVDDYQTDDAQTLFEEARKNAEQVQATRNDTDIRELIADIDSGIAHCLWQNNEFELALKRYSKVLADYKKLDENKPTPRIAQRQKDVADCYYYLKKWPQAFASYKESVATAAQLGDDADPKELAEARSKIELLRKRLRALGIPTESKEEHQKEYEKSVWPWSLYALGVLLLLMLAIYMSERGQGK